MIGDVGRRKLWPLATECENITLFLVCRKFILVDGVNIIVNNKIVVIKEMNYDEENEKQIEPHILNREKRYGIWNKVLVL